MLKNTKNETQPVYYLKLFAKIVNKRSSDDFNVKLHKLKKLILFIALQLLAVTLYSQAPQLINYQAIARDASGIPISGQAISIKFEFKQGAATVFSETQSVTTSPLGLFNTQIGKVSSLGGVDWQAGATSLDIFIDPAGGSNFTAFSSQQLVSVPYALHAATVPSSYADNVLTIAGKTYTLVTPGIVPTSVTATSGIATVTSAGTNTFDVNVPAPVFDPATGALTTGTAVANITPSLSLNGGVLTSGPASNSVAIPGAPAPTITGIGASTVISSGNNYTVNVATPTLTGLGTTTVTGAYPNYTVSSSSGASPTITGVGVSTVTSSGNNYTVNVATPSLTGLGTTTVTGAYPNYSINTAAAIAPTLTGLGTTTVTGAYPNYSINTASAASPTITGIGASTVISSGNNYTVNVATPTLTGLGTTTVTGSYPNYSINTAANASPTITGIGASTVTASGNNYTVNVATPSLTGLGTTTVTGAYPNYSITTAAAITPTLTGAGTTTVSGSYPNYTVSSAAGASPTITGVGISTVTSSGNSYTVNVAMPTLTGLGTTTISGAYPNYSINTAAAIAPTLTGLGTTTVTGAYPNYSINTAPAITPTLTGAGTTTVSGSYPNYTVSSSSAAAPTITGAGVSTVTSSGNNYTVNVATPSLTGAGTTTVSGSYPNYTISTASASSPTITGVGISTVSNSGNNYTVSVATPTLTGLGTTTVTGAYPNYSINTASAASPTITGIGASTVTSSGNNYTVNVATPSLTGLGTTTVTGAYPNYSINTSGLSGSGTSNYIPKWSSATSFVNSLIYDSGSSIGIGTTSPNGNLHVNSSGTSVLSRLTSSGAATGLVTYIDGSSAALLNYENTPLYFGTNAVNRMVIDATGNVGIANSSPAEKLDVTGNVKFSGALMPNNTAGTAGQILQSNGAGAAPTWVAGSGWSLTGTSGTTPGTNFIGTTDNKALMFKVNAVNSGLIDPLAFNTFLGYQSGNAVTTGSYNTGTGWQALRYNTSGGSNTAYGSEALVTNNTGNSNSAFGRNALYANSGSNNSGYGVTVLYINTGSYNSAYGSNAMQNNGSGSFNSVFGASAMLSNTVGANNAAFGYNALNSNNGSNNTAVGYGVMSSNATGSVNTAIGYQAGQQSTGNGNVFIGANAGAAVTAGSDKLYIANTSTATLIYGDFASKRVGVNNTAATEALDVTGNVRFSGALMPNNAAGTTGQILQSNGAGAAPTWITNGTGWSLNGTSGTTAGTNFIGTTDAQDVVFKSNNTEVFRAQSAGVVRLLSGSDRTITMQGQTSNIDANNLMIKGSDAGIGGQARYGGAVIIQGGDGYNQSNPIHFGGSVVIRPGKNLYGAASYNSGNIIFQNATPANAYAEAARIDPNGNMGIGITNPVDKLEVAGNIVIPTANDYRYASAKVRYASVSAAAFSPINSLSVSGNSNGNARWISSGTAGTAADMFAPVELPDGATITILDIYGLDNDAAYDIAATLVAYNMSSNTTSNLGTTFSSSGAASTPITLTASGLSHVVNNSTYSYYLVFSTRQNNANLWIRGARITYTVLKAD